MLRDYLPVLLQIVVAILFAASALLVSVIVGKSGKRTGAKDMLEHIGELYLLDSRDLIASIEESLGDGNSANLARAAHAWRSYNGNVGALGLARLCRELEDTARQGDFPAAREIYERIRALHVRVRDELEFAMRRSA